MRKLGAKSRQVLRNYILSSRNLKFILLFNYLPFKILPVMLKIICFTAPIPPPRNNLTELACYSDFFGISATIRTRQEIQCLPYMMFLGGKNIRCKLPKFS